MTNDLWATWRQRMGDTAPVGYVLRKQLSDRWLRLHTLPVDRRVPNTERELAQVVEFENLVATTVLGIGAPIIAFVAYWPPWPDGLDETRWSALGSLPFDAQEYEELSTGSWLGARRTWRPGSFDAELALRAVDRLGVLTLFSEALGNVFCPYDGGIDLVLSDAQSLHQLSQLLLPLSADPPDAI